MADGEIGFGKMSHPLEEDIDSWSTNPNGFTGEKISYIILCPSQTIYFEVGMIYFVPSPDVGLHADVSPPISM